MWGTVMCSVPKPLPYTPSPPPPPPPGGQKKEGDRPAYPYPSLSAEEQLKGALFRRKDNLDNPSNKNLTNSVD